MWGEQKTEGITKGIEIGSTPIILQYPTKNGGVRMADIAKVRNLLETLRMIAVHLTDDEISEIGKVLMKATDRMLKESEG